MSLIENLLSDGFSYELTQLTVQISRAGDGIALVYRGWDQGNHKICYMDM